MSPRKYLFVEENLSSNEDVKLSHLFKFSARPDDVDFAQK
jgi:hypothetical protein